MHSPFYFSIQCLEIEPVQHPFFPTALSAKTRMGIWREENGNWHNEEDIIDLTNGNRVDINQTYRTSAALHIGLYNYTDDNVRVPYGFPGMNSIRESVKMISDDSFDEEGAGTLHT